MTSPRVRFNLGDEERKEELGPPRNPHPVHRSNDVSSAKLPNQENGPTRQKQLNRSLENGLPMIQESKEGSKKRGRVEVSSVSVISHGNIDSGNKQDLNKSVFVCDNGTKQKSQKIQGHVKNSTKWRSPESLGSLNAAESIISGRREFQKDRSKSKLSFRCSRGLKLLDGTHSDLSGKPETKKTQNKINEPSTLISDSGGSFNVSASDISGRKDFGKSTSKTKLSTFSSLESMESPNGADASIKIKQDNEHTKSKEKVSKMKRYESLQASQSVQSKYNQVKADTASQADIGKDKEDYGHLSLSCLKMEKPHKVCNDENNVKVCKTIEPKPCICANEGCVICQIQKASKTTTAVDIDKLLLKSIVPHEFYDKYSRIKRNRQKRVIQAVPEVIQICKPMTASVLVPHAPSPLRPTSSPPAPPSSSLGGHSQENGSEFVFSETDSKPSFDVTLGTGLRKWDAHAQCKPKLNPLVQMDETTGTRVTIIRRPKGLMMRKVPTCKSKHPESIESPYAVESLGVTFCIADYNPWMKRRKSNDQKPLPSLVEKFANLVP